MSGPACTARPGLSPSSLCASSGCAGNGSYVPELQGFSPHSLVHSYTDKSYDCLSNAKTSGKAKKDIYIQNFHLLWAALSGECSVLLCCALTWVTSCPSPQSIVISEGILHMCSCHCFVQLLQGLQSTQSPAFQSFRRVLPEGVDHLLACLLYTLANDLAKMSNQFRKTPVIWIELKSREGILFD